MDKNAVIETAYELIKESLDWTDNYKSNGNEIGTYANYIDGIVTMTDSIISKLETENNGRPMRPVVES